MKYDPIMCMMVDDSVKTKDGLYDPEKNAGYELKKEGQYFKIYKNGKLVGMKSTEEEAAREAARHRAANDSKTIDHAIRSCDEDKDRYEVVKIGEFLYGIYDNIKKKVVIESTKTGIESYSKMFNAKNLNNQRKM
jgi:hypothetical protein